MDSYRVEKHRMRSIILEGEDAKINPVRTIEGGGRSEIETDRLSVIIAEFNDLFDGIEWGDPNRVIRTATVNIASSVAKDPSSRTRDETRTGRTPASNPTRRRSGRCSGWCGDNTQRLKLFADDPDFGRWLTNTAFRLTYEATHLAARG